MNKLAKAADQGDLDSVSAVLGEATHSQSELDLALARACCNSHLDVAEVLLDKGADPNGQYETADDEPDYGPIILASCEFLSVDGLRFLLEHGASPFGNAADSGMPQACTPLGMVRDTYMDNDNARRQCEDLLRAAGATG